MGGGRGDSWYKEGTSGGTVHFTVSDGEKAS